MAITDPTNALNYNQISDLRQSVKSGDANANHKVAQQFEGVFLTMMLKQMRSSLPGGDPLESDSVKMVRGMYDEQIAQSMAAGKGIGLASALEKQLNRPRSSAIAPGTGTTALPLHPADNSTGYSLRAADQAALPLRSIQQSALHYRTSLQSRSSSVPAASTSTGSSASNDVHVDFVEKYKDAAVAASQASGIPTKVILGQAALESGWGKHEVKDASGNGSYNLFGIKAGSSWTGPTVEATTTEYVNGVAQKVVQKFRAYASYAESFMDYAKTIASSPRYAHVMEAAHDALGFAAAMGRSGYATDPAYGQKLAQVISGPLRNLV
ncbi:MAG: flagellar assembly peptidoglycan hydrolase FlgJ [Burkholderiaceae bacterium]